MKGREVINQLSMMILQKIVLITCFLQIDKEV